ncbi:MAG: AIR synthase-related protein, partial [Actinomycetota bacterium]
CLEGEMRKDFPFFSSIRQRAGRLAGDVGLLPRLAEEGHCAAAKDVSMAGVLGSLATMLEPTRCGAAVDLKTLPRPEGVALAPWTSAFPTFAFLLCAPPAEADALRRAFRGRGLACEQVGAIDDTGRLRVSLGREESQLLDLTTESVTGLNGNSLAIAIEGESPSSGGDGRGTRPAPPSGASRGA